MDWLDRYTTKRTQELQQEIIRQQWEKVYLEKAAAEIRSKQEKNPSDWFNRRRDAEPLLMFPLYTFPNLNTRLSSN